MPHAGRPVDSRPACRSPPPTGRVADQKRQMRVGKSAGGWGGAGASHFLTVSALVDPPEMVGRCPIGSAGASPQARASLAGLFLSSNPLAKTIKKNRGAPGRRASVAKCWKSEGCVLSGQRIDDTLGCLFDRQRCCSLGQRPLRASFLAPAWPTAKIPRQFLSSIPLSG